MQAYDTRESPSCKKLPDLINEVRQMLRLVSDGNISMSPYDTAWVARVPSPLNSQQPEFPQCLDWIVENQRQDGSWGDEVFNIYDRILCTLSCILALKTWNIHDDVIATGKSNILASTEDKGDLLVGFELIFPPMVEEAKSQGLRIPSNHLFIQLLEELREAKLKGISLDTIHSAPTTVLFSLEGLQECIDWTQILTLQSEDGSFLTSPSSTACVYLHTKDEKCLTYLRNLVKLHKNAVPDFYPLDMFERLWVVDTLQRLGIDRFFKQEIKEILDYVYRYWDDKKGIGWARNVSVPELDCSGMGFRLLRLNGYDVSADVFTNFMKDGKFFCFSGERSHGISDVFSLFRASQVAYPKEAILDQAHAYSQQYLSHLHDHGLDKWAFKNDLSGEVTFELNNAFCSCPPRLYAKSYISKYGTDDSWIAKTIYRLPNVNNAAFLEMAKQDYDFCRSVLQDETAELSRWWSSTGISFTSKRVKLTDHLVNRLHFQIAAYIFEPELSAMRLAYTKAACLVVACDDLADHFLDAREYQELVASIERWDDPSATKLTDDAKSFYHAVYTTLNELMQEASKACVSTSGIISRQFAVYAKSVVGEVTQRGNTSMPTLEEYLKKSRPRTGIPAVIICSLPFCGIDMDLETLERASNCKEMELTCDIIRLSNDLATYKVEMENGLSISSITAYLNYCPETSKEDAVKKVTEILDQKTKELIQVYTQQSKDGLPQLVRRIIFETARTARLVYANGIKESRDELKLPGDDMQTVIRNIIGTKGDVEPSHIN
ncbi:hypothetical protein SELMODRAFT_124329 [Selaginella moellendorffii]|uniref:Uncharacterized protein n=1 Tax=Selaginella moellendorffii TaxID=88036 RepID=D8ST35_SELML|nr:hypothetical protein SELMODRAFT_124329 [Selaginella moellendorffii]